MRRWRYLPQALCALALLALVLYRSGRTDVPIESMAGAQRGKEAWVRRFVRGKGDGDSQPSAGMVADRAGNVYISGFVQIPHGGAEFLLGSERISDPLQSLL